MVSSQKVKDLKCFYSGKRISLPPVYTQEFIPSNITHIPTNETAKVWSHLNHLQEKGGSRLPAISVVGEWKFGDHTISLQQGFPKWGS